MSPGRNGAPSLDRDRSRNSDTDSEIDARRSRIAANFSRAASTYDAAASLQREVADDLLAGLPAIDSRHTIIDVGCGTGYLIARLCQGRGGCSIGLDIAPGMLAEACRRHRSLPIEWVSGCAERLPLANRCADLIVSSLAVQWCDSLDRFLSEAARVLRPGGWLTFTTLCDGTLAELQAVQWCVDGARRSQAFLGEAELLATLDTPDWRLQELVLTTRTTHHATPVAALQALKRIGANTMAASSRPNPGLSGRRRLVQLTQGLEAFREPTGIPTRYHVAKVSMQRRAEED